MSLLAVVALATTAIISTRAIAYGLFADDFGWLAGAQLFDPARLVILTGRTHFYRPVVEAYFAAALATCGHSVACYHFLNIILHAVTALLVAVMAGTLSRTWALGFLAGVLFVVQPAPVETIIWVSAVGELIATALFVLTVWLFYRSLCGGRRAPYVLSILSFAACLLTHESGVTLLAVLALVTWLFGPDLSSDQVATPRASLRRLGLLMPFIAAAAAYGLVAYTVNSRNYVITEGQYGIGVHILSNVVHSLVTLAVARRELPGLVTTGALALWVMFKAPVRMRLYVLWVIVTLLPFAGFRDGLASRYLYLPAVGFAALTAEVLWSVRRPLERWRRGGGAVWGALAIGVTLRCAIFAVENVKTWEQVSAPYREYAATVRGLYPSLETGVLVEVPQPPYGVGLQSVPALVQWEYADRTLNVVIRER